MEKTALTNEIFAYGRNVFKALHNKYGFDFEAPHIIFRVDGCYTVQSVRKTARMIGAANGATFVILYTHANSFRLSAVSLYGDSCDVNCAGNNRMDYENSFFNTAYKRDYSESRKQHDGIAYILFQNKEYVKPVANGYRYFLGWTERFRLISPSEGWWYDDTLSAEFIIDEGGKKLAGYRSFGFDKSGYCVSDRRRDLKMRADKIKAERRKAEIDHADVVAKALEIDAALAARKVELVNMLLSANTKDDFSKLAKAIGTNTWDDNSFTRAVYHAEDFKSRLKNNSFQSVADVQSVYNSVMRNLKS